MLTASLIILGLVAGVALAALGSSLAVAVTGALAFVTLIAVLLVLNQLELIATIIVAVSLFIDWYQFFGKPLRIAVAATVLSLLFVVFLFLWQSASHPWTPVPFIAAWILFLALTAVATLRWVDAQDSFTYYTGVIVNAFTMFVIGIQIARNVGAVARLFRLLSGLGTIVALHTILYVRLGIFLLATPTLDEYLQSRSSAFLVTGSNTADIRAGSFLYNPDWNGCFLALLVFLPVGLLLVTPSRRAKAVYAVETLLILVAALFTYSTAAIVAIGVGTVVYMALEAHRRLYVFGAVVAAAAAVVVGSLFVYPQALRVMLSHASNLVDLHTRLGLWETALNVIRAYPLTGTGIGDETYFTRSAPYLSPLQPRAWPQPHESYLELAAMAGLPVLVLFLFLVGTALRRIVIKLRKASGVERHLLASGFVALIVLSVNSLAIDGWTLAPIAAIAWLLLGALSSSAWPSIKQQLARPYDAWARSKEIVPAAVGDKSV